MGDVRVLDLLQPEPGGLALPRTLATSERCCVHHECWKSRENDAIFARAANLACIAQPFVVFISASILPNIG